MEIHQLEYFLAIEKYRSFSAASQEICVSQSTLSQQVKKLEEELGVKLFIRNSRTVNLSAAGKDFLIHAKRILSEVHYSKETMQKFTNFNKGKITIGTIPLMSYLGLNKLIANFAKSYPGFEVEIHSGSTNKLLEGLRKKDINAAFISTPYPIEFDIQFFPIVSEQVVLLTSANHRLAQYNKVDFADLSEETFLINNSTSAFTKILINECMSLGYKPAMINCGNYEMIKTFVEEGLGITLMGYSVAKNISNSKTKIVSLEQSLERQVGLALTKHNRLPITTSMFRDFTLNEAQKLI
ncbi:LysR family transcriptional regulator [Bacillus sp. Marseille-P3661]|uniref:LysR family transcriptional regulator n=1 Tax=Bacillus sp. Marseille-P3661 TaxID=1936234 RepID=UPI000C83A821|nr:LysR family transcriptional regulator [Bacillus sp. Marseille-P3661]